MNERCAICNCILHRKAGTYARPTVDGRSHATRHHHVAERFFGRSANRSGTKTEGIFAECPWEHEKKTVIFCYECHEELLHNPVMLPDDIAAFAEIVKARGLNEDEKPQDRGKIAGRVKLLHEILALGLASFKKERS